MKYSLSQQIITQTLFSKIVYLCIQLLQIQHYCFLQLDYYYQMTTSLKQKFSETDSQNEDVRQSFQHGSSFEDNSQEHHVLLLIKQTQEGELEPQEDCLELLGANDRPISFICILGDVYNKYAKVANQICQATDSGFLSESVRGNEGVWVYTKPFFNAKFNNVIYYILAKQSQLEPLSPKILSLVTLMSGSIIYVTDSNLNSKSLSMLRSLTQLEQYIIFATKSEQYMLSQLMPSFNWLLVGQKRPDQSKNLLQDYLNSGPDLIKRSVKSLFLKRETYFIQSNNDKKFSEKAIAGIGALKRKILVNTEGKSIKGQTIQSGSIGAVLIQTLTQNMNTKGVIPLNDVWDEINDITAKTAYDSAVAHYIQMYQYNFEKQQPKQQELYDILKQMRSEAIEQFDRNTSRQHSEKERKKLMQFLESHQKSIVEANVSTCQMHNLRILKRITTKIEQNMKRGKYKSKQILNEDFDQFVKQYKSQSKGPKKQVILNQFLGQFKGAFEKMIGSSNTNLENSSSGNFAQVHYDSQNPQDNLVFSLGSPSLLREMSTIKNKELQNQIQQLKQKLEAKELKNSMVLKKQEERLELQNEKIRQQMARMNTQQKPKSQKCCLLF